MTQHTIDRLREIMARLRNPNGGCPWDLEQNFSTIAPYTIEEAYEVADAISRDNMTELKGELGDLLLQVIFHSQMASEQGIFTLDDVITGICEKMIRRHPHVFGNAVIESAEAQTDNWEKLKASERQESKQTGVLANIPAALPALMRAQKLQSRAVRVGFDWPTIAGVIAKIREELDETEQAIESANTAHIAEEIGDLLFAVTNLARASGADAETVLRDANQKFIRRFEHIEKSIIGQNRSLDGASLEEMEALWNEAKALEKN